MPPTFGGKSFVTRRWATATEILAAGTSAEQVVRALVDDALAGGGTDNVTVLVVAGVRRH